MQRDQKAGINHDPPGCRKLFPPPPHLRAVPRCGGRSAGAERRQIALSASRREPGMMRVLTRSEASAGIFLLLSSTGPRCGWHIWRLAGSRRSPQLTVPDHVRRRSFGTPFRPSPRPSVPGSRREINSSQTADFQASVENLINREAKKSLA